MTFGATQGLVRPLRQIFRRMRFYFISLLLLSWFCLLQGFQYAVIEYSKGNDRDLEVRGIATMATKGLYKLVQKGVSKTMEKSATFMVKTVVKNELETAATKALGNMEDSVLKDIAIAAASSVITKNFKSLGKNALKRLRERNFKRISKETLKRYAQTLRTDIEEALEKQIKKKIFRKMTHDKLAELVVDLQIKETLFPEKMKEAAHIQEQRQYAKEQIQAVLGDVKLSDAEMKQLVDLVMRAASTYEMDAEEAKSVAEAVQRDFEAEMYQAEIYDPIFISSRYDVRQKILTLSFHICSSKEIRDDIMSTWHKTQEEKENAPKRDAIQKVSEYAAEELVNNLEL